VTEPVARSKLGRAWQAGLKRATSIVGLFWAGRTTRPILLLVGATLLLILGSGFLYSRRGLPTYSAEVRTEILSISMNARNTHRWFMVKPRVLKDAELIDTVEVAGKSGFVELFDSVQVTLSRHGNGKLLVQIESAVDDRPKLGPTAILHWDSIDGDTIPRADTAKTFLGVQVDSMHDPLTFPFVGWAILGADVPAERRFAPMLLSGRVETYGKTGKQRYRAGGAELEAGDKFAVIRPSKEKIGYGVIRIDPSDRAVDSRGMLVIYHAEGEEAQVSRFGTGGHRLSMSWLALLTSNPLYGVLAVVTVAIYTGFITTAWEMILIPDSDDPSQPSDTPSNA
jgi:hypothetical protein